MKRVVEKVKDIVEICPFTHLHDFAADPGLTLAGYHFTDITADLMSKWIGRIASVRAGQGAAFALAGFRGVGKSHFLSVLGAIVARPELRSRVSDPHVSSTAERLSRRHGPVAVVKRGTGSSLLDELKRAIGVILDTNSATLNDSLYDLLLRASEQAGDVPLVVLIDTALGRNARVARDDGAVLSEIADAAKAIGVFVGVALDDDISGADGANASISANFNIDYLDQEHLYKIVDSVIFSKHNQMRPVLHDIYEDYRSELPGFRWSEQRFTSLYPLHPATVEIAPLIRLYIHDFALLGFAADAGVKILGRPANSLIGLDEVFDGVESKLRVVPDLSDAFEAFDKLEREVIASTPVLFRHPAKLILKGLLILSLNGEGVSALEIAASMMVFGGGSPGLDVEELLDSFATELPNSISRVSRDGVSTKYCFRLASKVDVESILTEAIKEVPDNVVWKVLLGQAGEKWSDYNDGGKVFCNVEWRGGIRRGELIWPPNDDVENPSKDRKEYLDWTIRIEPNPDDAKTSEENATVAWRLAKLNPDEKDVIRRLHLLHSNPDIRTQYGDGLSTSIHVHSVSVEKIWQRIFFQDSYLFEGGVKYKFSEIAGSAHSLAQVFTSELKPIFESKYPAHPHFSQVLGLKQSAGLISGFLSGSGVNNADVQHLAENFAFPLGLAAKTGEVFSPVTGDEILHLDLVKTAFESADLESVIPLIEISKRLQAPPVGLSREAQHVLLAALVAHRQFEFVTSSGNRINHRSLDLQIIWDDIVGLAKPLNELYSAGRLLFWAQTITGNSAIKSIDRSEDRLLIVDSLAGWLAGWNQSGAIAEFDALPDENLNAGIWRTAANLRKSFGGMADIIDSLIKNDTSLAQCLQLIADLFSDTEAEYENKKSDLRVLREFSAGVKKRDEIATYLSLCENTGDEALEKSRIVLLETIESGKFASAGSGNERLAAEWKNFKAKYASYYLEQHDLVMNSALSTERLKEVIRSESWSVFESLSSIPWLDGVYFARAKAIIREMRQLYCGSKVVDSIAERPFCGCSFSLSESARLLELPDQLGLAMRNGISSYRKAFSENSQKLIDSADSEAMRSSVGTVLGSFTAAGELSSLSSQDIRILKIAAERFSDGRKISISEAPARKDYSDRIPDSFRVGENEVRKVEDFVNTEV